MENIEEDTAAFRCKIRAEKYDHWKTKRHMTLSSNRPELCDEEAALKNISIAEFRELVELIRKEKNKTILQKIQTAFALGENYVKEFLRVNGALYALTGILIGHDTDLQLDAASCITNLTIASHKPTFTVLKATAPYLITFLHGSSPLLQEQSAWALGNMAADCEICRKQLKAQGFLPAVVPLLKSPYDDVLAAVAFSLRCHTRYEQESARELLELGAGTMIFELTNRQFLDAGIAADIWFIVFHFSASIGDLEVERHFVKASLIEAVADQIWKHCCDGNIHVAVLTPLLRCLGNLCNSPVAAAVVVSRTHFLPSVLRLMRIEYVHIRKELFWMLTNLICNSEVFERLDLTAIVDNLAEMLKAKEEIVIEILYFLCTLLTNQPKWAAKISQTVIPQTLTSLTTSVHENVSYLASTACRVLQNSLLQ